MALPVLHKAMAALHGAELGEQPAWRCRRHTPPLRSWCVLLGAVVAIRQCAAFAFRPHEVQGRPSTSTITASFAESSSGARRLYFAPLSAEVASARRPAQRVTEGRRPPYPLAQSMVAAVVARGAGAVPKPSKHPVTTALRVLRTVVSVVALFVALLYVTSFFENVMHSTAGLIRGTSALAAGLIGVTVGTLHTVAGPDHLAALAPIVVGQRCSPVGAFGLGALWGSGHATGQMIIGLACLAVRVGLFRTTGSDLGDFLNQVGGVLVGVCLVLIGLLGYREAREYNEEGTRADENVLRARKGQFGLATYATGVLHGLSPDAIIFIMPALALPRLAAISHVVGVVSGTLVAMGAYAALLSALCRRAPRLRPISEGASGVAVMLGCCILAASFGLHVPLPGLE